VKQVSEASISDNIVRMLGKTSRIFFLGGCFVARALSQVDEPPQPKAEAKKATEGEAQVQEDPIRVDVNLVMLRFTVKDRAQRFVNTLSKEDFRILEEGAPREVVFFEAPKRTGPMPERLWLAFLLDVSGSTFATRAEEIIAAQTFLDNVHSFTRVGVFGFTDKLIPFQDFTKKRGLAAKAFQAARRHLGQTAIYASSESLIAELDRKAARKDGRVLIVVSDGMDDEFVRSARTASLARSAGVTIYTILVPSAATLYIGPTPSSVHATPEDEEEKKLAFGRLSQSTGGKHFSGLETILDFDTTLARISDDIFGNLYGVGYYSSRVLQERQLGQISIDVRVPGMQASDPFKQVPELLQAKRQFIAALFDSRSQMGIPIYTERDFKEIGAEIDILRSRREGASSVGLPFRIKISPFTLSRGSRGGIRTQLGIIGQLLDSAGNEVVRLREFFRATLSAKEIQAGRGIIYTNKLFAPPGEYQLRMALLEIPSWKIAVFESPVRITSR
jgi:VWFA-related protein